MAAISGSSWGSSTNDLRSVYIATIESRIMYASSAWSPLLTDTRANLLQVIQNKAARIATHCHKATLIQDLHQEFNRLSIRKLHNIQTAIVAEKARRLPVGDPLRDLAFYPTQHEGLKFTNQSWQHRSDDVLKSLNMNPERLTKYKTTIRRSVKERENDFADIRNRESTTMFPMNDPSKVANADKVHFSPDLFNKCSKSDNTDEERRIATEVTLNKLGSFDFQIWTDGSVIGQVGAGAALLFRDDEVEPFKIKHSAAGYLCSSYMAEAVAIRAGLNEFLLFATNNNVAGATLIICSDSQSNITSLKSGPLRQTTATGGYIWKILLKLLDDGMISKVVFQFVASHCGVTRNEAADKQAELALNRCSDLDQSKIPIPMAAIKAVLKTGVKNKELESFDLDTYRGRICGSDCTDLRKSSLLSREDETLLHQLRTGECKWMGKFRNRLKIGDSTLCRWCGAVDETVEHVFNNCESVKVIDIKNKLRVINAKVLHIDPPLGLLFFRDVIGLLKQDIT